MDADKIVRALATQIWHAIDGARSKDVPIIEAELAPVRALVEAAIEWRASRGKITGSAVSYADRQRDAHKKLESALAQLETAQKEEA